MAPMHHVELRSNSCGGTDVILDGRALECIAVEVKLTRDDINVVTLTLSPTVDINLVTPDVTLAEVFKDAPRG